MSFPDSGILVVFDGLIKSNERQMWHSVENGFCRFKGSKYSRLLLLRVTLVTSCSQRAISSSRRGAGQYLIHMSAWEDPENFQIPQGGWGSRASYEPPSRSKWTQKVQLLLAGSPYQFF